MKITWLGHSGFRIETAGAVLLIDPWLTGNPMFEASRRADAIAGATHLLASHGHGDHSADAAAIAKELGIPLVGTFELATHLAAKHGIEVMAFNLGGTVRLGGAAVTMVGARHSSSLPGAELPVYAGTEAGFMIEGDGRTIYFSGDTDVMADMAIYEDLHHPEIGILAAGGLFTMDMKRAAYAARKFFNFKTVIPCHYRTFPMLAQNAEILKAGLPGVDVIEPEVMATIDL